MKGYIFLLAVIVLLVVAYNYKVEGFKTEIVIPNNVPQPKSVDASSPDPYMEPAEKQYGPAFGDIAKVNSLPYRDPAQEKTNYKNLAELKESLAGFIAYEAKGLQENSDPTIQLPLTTLRSDYQRVSDEVDVLKRNPGIDADMTLDSANQIRANLAYLQKKYRLSVNSDIGQIEGFEDGTTTSARATLQDLKDALSKIKAEILRMSVSGTTDPVLNARVNVLTKMSKKVQDIIDDVNSGARTTDQIPVMKSDLKDFLSKSSDVSSPVTNFVDENNLPPTLANLFPAYQAGDISGAKITQYLFNKYADTVVKGLSWSVGLKYTSPNEAAAGSSGAATNISGTGLDGAFESITDAIGSTTTNGSGAIAKNKTNDFSSPSNFARGEFEATTNPSSRTSGYDWKEKSAKICEAIRSRGLNPGDFGCLDSSSSVGSDYSWRGNARMVCTRLQASYDPGLPDYCGCPPVDWAGWRS